MNRSELIAALAEHKGLKSDEATAVVEAFFDTIKEALATGNRVEIDQPPGVVQLMGAGHS
jgi:integration host factor subunit beta